MVVPGLETMLENANNTFRSGDGHITNPK